MLTISNQLASLFVCLQIVVQLYGCKTQVWIVFRKNVFSFHFSRVNDKNTNCENQYFYLGFWLYSLELYDLLVLHVGLVTSSVVVAAVTAYKRLILTKT